MEEVWFHRIDAYLGKKLSPKEQDAFEEKMAGDKELRQAVAEVVAMKLALGEVALEGKPPQIRRLSLKRNARIAIVAAASLLLFSIFLWPDKKTTQAPLALYAQYYEPALLPTFRTEETDERWEQALTAYRQKQYAEAIPLFEGILQVDSFAMKPAAYLGLGISYLEIDAPQEAMTSFAFVPASSALGPEAQWYTALALLKMQRLDEARLLLEKIRDSAHYQREKARLLLLELGE